jgi:hypothetical protein
MMSLIRFAPLLLLAACATAPAAPDAGENLPVAPPAPAVSSRSSALDLLARSGQADAPTIGGVQAALGSPDVERREAAGAIVTYRLESCALVLLFATDTQNQMRLVGVERAARLPGAETPSLEACASELDARRSAAPLS